MATEVIVVVQEDNPKVEVVEVVSETSISTPGPPGPPGATGPPGGESHLHTQSSASTLWTVSPPWDDRLPISITVFIDKLGVLIDSTDSVIITMIDDGPSFTVDVGNNPESGKVTVS